MVTFSPSKAALRVQVPLSAPKYANMAKLEYASGLSPDGGNTVWVRLPLLAPLVPPPDTINRELIVESRSKSGNSRETPFGQG